MIALVAAGCAVLGLCVGSFLNVVIWRVPRGESIVRPGSRCPACGRELTARDLVPVVSWLALRGRCRTCGARISARYPLVELATGITWGLIGARFATSWVLPAYLVFAAVLVVLTAIDLDTRTLPRRIIYAGGAAGAILLAAGSILEDEPGRLLLAVAGAAIAFAFFLTLHLISPGWMGFGDVRLSAYIGGHPAWLGLLNVAVGLFLSFATGAVVGIALIVGGRVGRRTAVPFGPFLAAGSLIAVLAGEQIIDVWLPD